MKKFITMMSACILTLGLSSTVITSAQAETTPSSVDITNDFLMFGTTEKPVFQLSKAGTYSYTIKNSSNILKASGTVKNSKTISVNKILPLGYYTVQITQNGKIIETQNFGIIDKTLQDDDFYSVATHYGQNKEQVWNTKTAPVLRDLGFGKFRDEIYWKNVETTKGKLTIPAKDKNFADVLKKEKINWLFIGSYGNALYGTSKTEYNMDAKATQLGYANYVNYVLHQRPEIKEIELYNEFNNITFNTGCRTGTCYANFVKTVSPFIRAKNPNVKIIGGVTASSDDSFFQSFIKADGAKYVDYWSLHPYAFTPKDLTARLERFNGWQDDYNKGNTKKRLKYEISEFGWSNSGIESDMPTRENYQASVIVEAYANALNNNNIKSFTWYDGINDGPQLTATQHNFGLLKTSGNGQYVPKKSAIAFNNMRSELKDYTASGTKVLTKNGKNVRIYAFTHNKTKKVKYIANVEYSHQAGYPNDKVQVSLKDLNFKKEINYQTVEVTDVYGVSSNKTKTVTVGNTPVFIDNVSSQQSFKDVKTNNLFYNEIEEMAANKITTGWSDGTYRPLNNVNRDALIVFIYRSMGSPKYTAPKKSPFIDVSTSNVYYKEISWAYSKGIVKGVSTSKGLKFNPTTPATRSDMAEFLYNASGDKLPAYNSKSFKDIKSSTPNARAIIWMKNEGVSTGWNDGTYRPNEKIKRDAVSAFVVRWMQLP